MINSRLYSLEDFAGRSLEGIQREGIGNVEVVASEEAPLPIPTSAKYANNSQKTARRMAPKWF